MQEQTTKAEAVLTKHESGPSKRKSEPNRTRLDSSETTQACADVREQVKSAAGPRSEWMYRRLVRVHLSCHHSHRKPPAAASSSSSRRRPRTHGTTATVQRTYRAASSRTRTKPLDRLLPDLSAVDSQMPERKKGRQTIGTTRRLKQWFSYFL